MALEFYGVVLASLQWWKEEDMAGFILCGSWFWGASHFLPRGAYGGSEVCVETSTQLLRLVQRGDALWKPAACEVVYTRRPQDGEGKGLGLAAAKLIAVLGYVSVSS
ncbi:unnamed protein product, partial [Ectocarpus sp. 4 AP-2014]